MIIQRVLAGLLIALTIVFLGFQIASKEMEASALRALLAILLTLLYYINTKKVKSLFFFFLVLFSIGEILNFVSWQVRKEIRFDFDYFYYGINSIYIIAYTLLIIMILSSMNLREVAKKYPFHILILLVLDVFSVLVVTNTILHKMNFYQYSVELIYNAVIMILLTVALINFLSKDDKKSINFLMGSIFVFFSEVIQLAYFYVSEINLLNIICSLFIVLAFLFFYVQSQLSHESQDYTYRDMIV